MKAIGACAGQVGDIIMGTVFARAHKQKYPESHLVCGIADKYGFTAPLLEENEFYDSVHIWDGYNDWPTASDRLHIAQSEYDIVYNAMPQHTEPFWYLHRHQTAEMCLMHGLEPPENLQASLSVNGERENNIIALSLFGVTRGEEKSCSVEQGKQIVELIRKLGYKPVQIGLVDEPSICEDRFLSTLQGTAEFVKKSAALITIDTAMAWIASGFSHPTIGLYSYKYYPMATTAKNWMPVNPNAIYLESNSVSNIISEKIEAAIKQL